MARPGPGRREAGAAALSNFGVVRPAGCALSPGRVLRCPRPEQAGRERPRPGPAATCRALGHFLLRANFAVCQLAAGRAQLGSQRPAGRASERGGGGSAQLRCPAETPAPARQPARAGRGGPGPTPASHRAAPPTCSPELNPFPALPQLARLVLRLPFLTFNQTQL